MGTQSNTKTQNTFRVWIWVMGLAVVYHRITSASPSRFEAHAGLVYEGEM